MFNRENHIAMMRRQAPLWSEEEIQKDADFMEEKHSHIKYGNNVVHLNYSKQLIPEETFKEIENRLKRIQYELSSYESSGILNSSFDAFQSQVVLALSSMTVEMIIQGVATNAIWDGIKTTANFIWSKVNDATYTTWESGGTITEKRASFSLKMQLDENTTLDFNMNDIEEGEAERCLDKVLEFAKQAKRNATPRSDEIILYNKETNEWEKVIFTPELLRKPSDRIIRKLSLEDYKKEKGIK